MLDNLNDNLLLRLAFGWSYKAWSHAFKVSNFQLPNKVDRILEIGASENSMVALVFDGVAGEIVISYYSAEQKKGVEQYLASVRKKYRLKSEYTLEKIDATTIEGSFDIVVMKSVLGGLFRENNSTIFDVTTFIGSLVSRAVKPEGLLISIDNGKSVIGRTLSGFGARKTQWRFFGQADLLSAIRKSGFGVISSFSLETRFGYLGYVLDNYLIYPIDLVLYRFWRSNPTVIVSVFGSRS